MIKVKFTEKYSQDGYMFEVFDNYAEFGEWYIKNFNKFNIFDIVNHLRTN